MAMIVERCRDWNPADQVVISRDWSGLELVLIGDASGDTRFRQAFGQIPYEDMHAGTAADILSVEVPDLTEELFKKLKTEPGLPWHPRLITNLKGETMLPDKAFGYWRTEIGKGANFNYWYSGWLATIGQRMGWDMEKTGAATERYRNRFPEAEAWRLATIAQAERDGYVKLPDGHRRVRFEVTPQWRDMMWAKFHMYDNPALNAFGNLICKAIQTRAKNQIVNARIQGTNATMTKRVIPRINAEIVKRRLWARFMLPIHDEVLYSAHRNDAIEVAEVMNYFMTQHESVIEICPTLPLHSTCAFGRTFEPFHPEKVPFGQIELNEAPKVTWLPKEVWGKPLDTAQMRIVLEYLFTNDNVMRAAA